MSAEEQELALNDSVIMNNNMLPKVYEKQLYFLGIKGQEHIELIKEKFHLEELEKTPDYISSKQLKRLARAMVNDGIFKKVSISDYTFVDEKKQLIFLYLKAHENLYQVVVENKTSIDLNVQAWLKIFKPKFKNIINRKYTWKHINNMLACYRNNGYEYIRMKLLYSKNRIKVLINQAEINHVVFFERIRVKDNYEYKKIYENIGIGNKIPTGLIKRVLRFDQNQSLNSNYVDLIINEFKNNHVLDTCRYEISSSGNTLDVMLYIDMLPDRSIYTLYHNIQIHNRVANHIYFFFSNSAKYLLVLKKTVKTAYDLYKESLSRAILLMSFENFHNISTNKIFAHKNLYLQTIEYYDFHQFTLLDTVKNSWSVRYNRRYLGRRNKNIVLDFSSPYSHDFFQVMYRNPWVLIGRDTFGRLSINYRHELMPQDGNLEAQLASWLRDKLLVNSDTQVFKGEASYVSRDDVHVQLDHRITEKFHVQETVSKQIGVDHYSALSNHKNYEKLYGQQSLYKQKICNFSNIDKLSVHRACSFTTVLHYDDTNYIDWINEGYKYNLKLETLYKIQDDSYPKKVNIDNHLIGRIDFKQALYLTPVPVLDVNNKHFMIVEGGIKFWINKFLLDVKPDNKLQIPNDASHFIVGDNNLQSYNLQYEFHKQFKYFFSYFFHSSWISNAKSKRDIVSIEHTWCLGMGVQVNVPIYKTPPLCIRYDFLSNSRAGISIYFRSTTK
uniref:hypothetical protein n=1 Tax=Timspurckia oligopyrenoides TaxID=708627 RepID=UPI001FCD083B|nr:hypothetical protein MW591_pgp034 [Timspurckia oligopyrenoides]UNJ17581.1 hypothetical protein [Timspurckia oligopyrenoides]